MMECPQCKKQFENGRFCTQCGVPLSSAGQETEPAFGGDRSREPLFMHMSFGMLLFMGFITHGLFVCYWVYRNWRYLKERLGLSVSPILRGVFYLFFIHTLLGRINRDEETQKPIGPAFIPFLCATGVVAGMLLSNFVPVLAGVIPVTFLGYTQEHINEINKKRDPAVKNYPLTWGQHVLIAIGVFFLVFDFRRMGW